MAEERIVRAAAVQISPDLDRPEGTLARVFAAIDEACAKGARFVVFPETFVPYYRTALTIASERVKARYGFPCGLALGQLARIEAAALLHTWGSGRFSGIARDTAHLADHLAAQAMPMDGGAIGLSMAG